jgi:hypothetical protein
MGFHNVTVPTTQPPDADPDVTGTPWGVLPSLGIEDCRGTRPSAFQPALELTGKQSYTRTRCVWLLSCTVAVRFIHVEPSRGWFIPSV